MEAFVQIIPCDEFHKQNLTDGKRDDHLLTLNFNQKSN